MKLMTEMVDGRAESRAKNIDEEDNHFQHDAAAAHALMQGVREWSTRQALWVEYRADELMREWGFDSTPEQPE